MNQLIPTKQNDDGNLLVSGRELHDFLGVKYVDWLNRMKEYGFVESVDFIPMSEVAQKKEGSRLVKREITDHHLKLNMAKEISMIQRSDKGKEARLYFLKLEENWNSPEMVLKRAHDYLTAQVAKLQTNNLMLEQRVSEFEPKASYYDTVLQNKSTLSISKIAKDYGFSGIKLNKLLNELGIQFKQGDMWLLYQKYADKGYTQSKTHIIDADNSRLHTQWTQNGRLFIYDLLKNEKGVLPIIERDKEYATT